MSRARIKLVMVIAGCATLLGGQAAVAGSCCGSGARGGGSGGHAQCSESEKADTSVPTARGSHGGIMTSTKANLFETVIAADGIRIFRYGLDGAPRSIDEAGGTIEVKLPGGAKQKVDLERGVPAEGMQAIWFCPMHPEVVRDASGACPICGMSLIAQDFLYAPIELELSGAAHGHGAEGREVEARIKLKGLGEPERKAQFSLRGRPVVETTG